MDWFGNSLSNVKDQFTSLTRDLLSEADEEPRFVPVEKFNRLLMICQEKEDQLSQLQLEVDELRNASKIHVLPKNTDDSGFDNVDLSNCPRNDSKRDEHQKCDDVPSRQSPETEADIDCSRFDEDKLDENSTKNILQKIENIGGKSRLTHLGVILKEVKLLYDAEKKKMKSSSSVISFPSSKHSHGTDETMSNDSERSDDSLLNDFEVLKPRRMSTGTSKEFSAHVEEQTSMSSKCSTSNLGELEFTSDVDDTKRKHSDNESGDSTRSEIIGSEFIYRSLDTNFRCWEEIFGKVNSILNDYLDTDVHFGNTGWTFWSEMNELVFKNNAILKSYVFSLIEENRRLKKFYEGLNEEDKCVEEKAEKNICKHAGELRSYREKLENFNQSLNKVSDEILDETSELNLLYEELKCVNKTKNDLIKEKIELMATITQLQGCKNEDAVKEYIALESKYVELCKKQASLENDCELLRNEIVTLKDQLREAESVNDSLDSELHATRNLFIEREQDLKSEIESLKNNLRLVEDEKNDINEKLSCESYSLNRKLSSLENINETLVKAVQEAQESLSSIELESKNKIDNLLEKIRALELEKKYSEKNVQIPNKNNLKSELNVDDDNDEINNCHNRKELECELHSLKIKLEESEKINETLGRKLQEISNVSLTYEELIKNKTCELKEKFNREILILQSQLEETKKTNNHLNIEVQKTRIFLENYELLLEKQIENCRSDISNLEQSENRHILDDCQSAMHSLLSQFKKTIDFNETLLRNLKEVKNDSFRQEPCQQEQMNDLRRETNSKEFEIPVVVDYSLNESHSIENRRIETEKLNESLMSELREARNSQETLEKKTESLEEKIRALMEEMISKQNEFNIKVMQLQKLLDESKERNETLELALKESNIVSSEREQSLLQDIQKLKHIENEAVSSFEKWKSEIISKNETISSLNSLNKILAADAEVLKSNFDIEINVSKAKLNDLEEENRRLSHKIQKLLVPEGVEEPEYLGDLCSIFAAHFSSSEFEIWTKLTEFINNTCQKPSADNFAAEFNVQLEKLETEKNNLSQKVASLEKNLEQQIKLCAEQKENIFGFESKLHCMTVEREQLITSLKDKHNESLSYHNELQKVHALYADEMRRNKEYSEQIHELKQKMAKHSSTVAEIERLRAHLLSMEESHTNDLLISEEQIKELKNQLSEYEDRIKSINATQTSVNVRTNQITESLQNEIKTLTEEKEKLTLNLRNCQTELQRSVYDAQNLRSALDLFHRNKDCEISQATEKLRTDIQSLQNDNRTLQETVQVLQDSLNTMKDISSRNNELCEEIRCKESIIRNLELRVENAVTELNLTQAKINELKEGTENKFKQDLLKNVILQYVIGNNDSMKTQALQILAEILGFTADERHRAGLGTNIRDAKSKHEADSSKNKSLIDEFIKFVEIESNPGIKKGDNTNPLHSSAAPLPDVMLPTLSPFPTNHNSRYILKDVLR